MITSELRTMHGLSYNSHDQNLEFMDEKVMGHLTQEMENLVIDSQIKVNPKLNSVWTKIIEKPEEPPIRGTSVDTLVDQYLAATGMTNKTEAVRRALSDQLNALAAKESLTDRVARIQRRAAEAGFVSTDSDIAADKAFMDEQWGED